MITIFNRKELFITFSMQKQIEIVGQLQAMGIDYDLHVTDRNSPKPLPDTRGRGITLGMNPDNSREYKIYVKKEDFERAKAAINRP